MKKNCKIRVKSKEPLGNALYMKISTVDSALKRK